MNEGLRKWKAAIAELHKQQRQQRRRRKTGIERIAGPGMVRLVPRAQDGAQDGGDGGDQDGDGPWHD